MKCRICGNAEGNRTFIIKEMMFGTHENFDYFECSCCGCLQIFEAPENMSKYYPEKYYLSAQIEPKRPKRKTLKNFLKLPKVLLEDSLKTIMLKARVSLSYNFVRERISFSFPYSIFFNLPKESRIDFNSRILEVGCGRGDLLSTLRNLGFKNVLGVDPYANCGVEGVEILRSTIYEISNSETFDLIILNHSFEHIWDQLETLIKVSKILSESGTCVIRIPVKTEYIWNRYGVSWVQIDAPRHFFLHTLKSMRILSEKAGMLTKNAVFDSSEFQFWGSEQYKNNVPLRAWGSYWVNPEKSMFSLHQISEYRKLAEKLNKIEQGDQAEFHIVKNKKESVKQNQIS